MSAVLQEPRIGSTTATAAPTPGRSVTYPTLLTALSWASLATLVAAVGLWVASPYWERLISLLRLDLYKQITGYTLLALLAFDLSLAVFKRRLSAPRAQRALQISHRILGLLMLVLLILHAGLEQNGYLQGLFALTLLVVLGGAVFNLLPRPQLARWGAWVTGAHIVGACLLGGLTLMHLYFVFRYAS